MEFGVAAAVNAARGGAVHAFSAVADGGRLATITSDFAATERGITIHEVYVHPDGPQLATLAELMDRGELEMSMSPRAIRWSRRPGALTRVLSGGGGAAIVLVP